MTNSNYFDFTNASATPSTNYDETFNYDKRGNLLTLTRNNESGAQIDNLAYNYFANSNQLYGVSDFSTTAGFNKGVVSNGAQAYTYSANGNVIQDLHKGITSTQQITYNYLDLPTEIKSTTGRITMLYDAAGTLLCRTTFNASNVQIEKRDYIGNFEYINGVIDEVSHSQGRYKSVSGTWRHEFEIADHLGNARVIYTDASTTSTPSITVVQEMNYYAYGMQLPGNWQNGDYRYKYNGIERVESLQLDFALYRGLDPVLGRWMQVDPKAEAMRSMSPYCSMNNNPISMSDPNGDLPFLALVAIGAATGVFSNGLSNVSNGQSFLQGASKAALWGGIGAAASFGVGSIFGASGSFGHELLRAGAHGYTQGGISAAQGGNFWQGALSGSIGSGLSSGATSLGMKNLGMVAVGGLGGGIGSSISGGSFWKGLGQGITVSLFNHSLHVGASSIDANIHVKAARTFLTDSGYDSNSVNEDVVKQQDGFFGAYYAQLNNASSYISNWTPQLDSRSGGTGYVSPTRYVKINSAELGLNGELFTQTRKVGYALKFYGNRNNSIGLVKSGIAHYIEAGLEYFDGKVRNVTGYDNVIYNMHYINSYNYIKYR